MIDLLWGMIGLVVGLVMGLTGAGGAVVSVPLFVHLMHESVAQATTFSLLVVTLGASLNWIFQRRLTDFVLALSMAAFSWVGAYALSSVKAASPDWVISALFTGVCVLSIAIIWLRHAQQRRHHRRRRRGVSASHEPPPSLITLKKDAPKLMASGFLLGATTTMTGLGGGVFLIPWLIGPLHRPLERAVPTSLLTMAMTAIGSTLAQWHRIEGQVTFLHLAALTSGLLVSAFTVQSLIARIPPNRLNPARRWLITGIILLSIGGLYWR